MRRGLGIATMLGAGVCDGSTATVWTGGVCRVRLGDGGLGTDSDDREAAHDRRLDQVGTRETVLDRNRLTADRADVDGVGDDAGVKADRQAGGGFLTSVAGGYEDGGRVEAVREGG